MENTMLADEAGRTPPQENPTTSRSHDIFYKLVEKSILLEKQLDLPQSFSEIYGDELSNVVFLTASTPGMWAVCIKKDNQRVWLRGCGWQKFVEAQSICAGFFLVFKYKGESVFHVDIYKPATPKIKNASNAPLTLEKAAGGKQLPRKKDDLDSSIGIVDHQTSCEMPSFSLKSVYDDIYRTSWDSMKDIGQSSSTSVFQEEHNTIMLQRMGVAVTTQDISEDNEDIELIEDNEDIELIEDIEDVELIEENEEIELIVDNEHIELIEDYMKRTGKKVKSHPSGQAKPRCRKRKAIAEPKVNEDEFSTEDVLVVKPSAKVSSRSSRSRCKAESAVAAAASCFKSDHPFITIFMKPSYVSGRSRMNIPHWFAHKHLRGVSQDMKLQLHGKLWPVKFVCMSNYCGIQAKGWYTFVKENHLEEADACVFELVNKKNVVLKVTIFRSVDFVA